MFHYKNIWKIRWNYWLLSIFVLDSSSSRKTLFSFIDSCNLKVEVLHRFNIFDQISHSFE